jgi:ABC-type Fe3+ transport system permease subunit
MLAPAIGGAALLVFMTSMGSFSAPYVFGGGFRVLTTQLYASKLNGETGLVAVEAVVLAAASLLFLVMLQRWEAAREYTGASKGLGAAPAAAGRGGWGITLLGAALVGFLLLPHATVLLVSFVPRERGRSRRSRRSTRRRRTARSSPIRSACAPSSTPGDGERGHLRQRGVRDGRRLLPGPVAGAQPLARLRRW